MSGPGDVTAFRNRLEKNSRHLRRWIKRESINAWRVYDRDIPEFPYAIDRYGDALHVQLFAGKRELDETDIEAQRLVISDALGVDPARQAFKLRRRQRGQSQYEVLDPAAPSFVVEEGGLKFEVNLGRYLDTGLFLDHRPLRSRVRQEAAGKRMLNLFAYTGSFSVYAAAGGAAHTLSVDLSRTYQQWTRRNLTLNGFTDDSRHALIATDVLTWLEEPHHSAEPFDIIVIDPPSFSNSKRMHESFDVQRDHLHLLSRARLLLAVGGSLYFSNNRQGFRLAPELAENYTIKNISSTTIPADFNRRRPHQCWHLTAS